MKKLLYRLHSKWSLIAALMRLRNLTLRQHQLLLPNKDYAAFFPYIISVRGRRKKTVKDPLNIVAYGVGREEFVSLLIRANPKWHRFLGSSYFLYTYRGWKASIALGMDITKEAKERHHIRLFELKTRQGEKIVLCAAHHDWPYHTEDEPPFSWDETRDLVASDISSSGFATICGLSGEVTERNFRNAEGDGKILIIKAK